MRFAAALALVAGAATAQDIDFVESSGKLDVETFYRAVACAAAPGDDCQWTMVRWPPDRAADLRIRIRPPQGGWSQDRIDEVSRALDRAIAEINGVGAGIRMRRVDKGSAAEIDIHLVSAGVGTVIEGTRVAALDGLTMQGGYVTLAWDDDLIVRTGAIAIARDLWDDEVDSVMLEELTQATGLLTDIRNPYYEGRSIFSEDSNSVTRLGYADRAALRLHYPPVPPPDPPSASAP